MASADEDEWEYEYSSTETEDFYIPLDLSNTPEGPGNVHPAQELGHPTLLKSRLRAYANRRETSNAPSLSSHTAEAATFGEVQITGLHTSNPLVLYNDNLFSCHWASNLGTDMFFVKPDAGAANAEQPLRSLPRVDLLATGSAKLTAKIGRLRPRDELFEDQPSVGSVSESMDNTTSTPQSPKECQAPEGAKAQPKSTDFLAKLNQAKAKRGEKTRLAASRSNHGSRLVSESTSGHLHAVPRRHREPAEDLEMIDMRDEAYTKRTN